MFSAITGLNPRFQCFQYFQYPLHFFQWNVDMFPTVERIDPRFQYF